MNAARPARLGLKELLFMPVGCFLSLSAPMVLGVIALLTLAIGYVYYNVNVPLPGLGGEPFKNLKISQDFKRIEKADGSYLTISYELPIDSTFTGLVRHISPIRESRFPILTHDILVTSGDFADSQKVKTSVFNHHFSWSAGNEAPKGKINLLHTVPANKEIYDQLFALRNGDTVRIAGREIFRIEAFDPQARSQGWWQDSGCNTLVVTSVEVNP